MKIKVFFGPSGVGKTTHIRRLWREKFHDAAFHDAGQQIFGDDIYEMLLIDRNHSAVPKILGFIAQSFQVEIAELEQRSSDQFSLGQQRRIAFLRNMLGERRCKLFDEPFSNLDTVSARDILYFVKNHLSTYTDDLMFTSHHDDFLDDIVYIKL